MSELFAGLQLEERIRARALDVGITISEEEGAALARQALSVSKETSLHLTSIRDPHEFIERHLGEAFEGAALLEERIEGLYVDLGSGNGYPAVPLAMARRGLRLLMTEASAAKAAFLERAIGESQLAEARVLATQIQRGADLPTAEPLRLLSCRAMGAWPKIVPRLVPNMDPDGHVLIWCGEELEQIARRHVWRRLRVVERRPLPGREKSFVWHLRPAH